MARDGEEGLEFVQLGRHYDIVVSDVVMPSMDGPAMAREIRKLAPDMPVLFMSGYSDQAPPEDLGPTAGGAAFIHKPFDAGTLLERVRELLTDAARPG